ncbi:MULTISPECIES: aspartate 1-decarboxylase [Methylobacillus]|uniref:Aspartate 1-decarboxylase n=1 Tax=Methylobacillus flagellatus (strain ATCC 51484 / DSM 6875 / VKM B-1610 / KT) TaxID=265072 RepID=PAND_METFK|nr:MULTISPECIES: aspartate 1-decarboxylase [Methylobacillus]Q1H3S3.1 RecName: Full=Aspartate 1-decarboxylase; AltName: Full=Aspartate alpha-decarboxylase; Contains: RecName: Full=Aspartate 1-decarboxylase beta chain; Contains: RecName: Full=Aspartate 1-decarboxylase alpha chain; Flags: Precursor [Methylobacillus flagellatus KT]ABE48864.1 aspartate 1-decarboxylase [Methylobacillus flagellatus KT]MPS49498.1 aspartate 1-decarboxylase [Methylobacillus sp.]
MQRTMLKSKLHRVHVTHSELDYEGSCAIDEALLEAADIKEYQQIDIYNVNNGERFTTYAIRAERNSGIISVNGAAARKASPGDLLIIATYASYTEAELAQFKPQLVYVDADNRIKNQRQHIPVQAA